MGDSAKIVVIGTSRGGVKALCRLLHGLPADLPAAVLVVLHTSPSSPRFLADILTPCTKLSVRYGGDGDPILPACVYIAPPDVHMLVTGDARIALDHGPKQSHSRPAADLLFRSAAAVFGADTIGVILTGGNHDGSDGLNAITAAGGTSIVQNPVEAEDPTMPINALQKDHPDACLPLALIAEQIIALTAA